MLEGELIRLQPVRRTDLELVYSKHTEIANRGEFFPTKVQSEPGFYRQFEDSGFWGKDAGMLLIVEIEGQIIGQIEFFKTENYLDEFELSYQLFNVESRGNGYATEAVGLLVAYLFSSRKMNRIRLIIHPENRASRRVAEKCRFKHESTARGAWYHQGTNHDVEVYALLRTEFNQPGE